MCWTGNQSRPAKKRGRWVVARQPSAIHQKGMKSNKRKEILTHAFSPRNPLQRRPKRPGTLLRRHTSPPANYRDIDSLAVVAPEKGLGNVSPSVASKYQ